MLSHHDRNRLEDILHTIPSAVVLLDVASNSITYLNHRAMDLYEMDSTGLAHADHLSRIKILRADGLPFDDEQLPIFRTLRLGETVLNVDIIVQNANGRRFPAQVSTAPLFGPSGEVETVIINFDDMTERKQLEQSLYEHQLLYHTILDNSHDGISLLNLKTGQYDFMNRALLEITGLLPPEHQQYLAADIHERIHPDDRQAFILHQQAIASGQNSQIDLTVRWRMDSGDYRWLSNRTTLVRDGEGQSVALVSMNRDLTEERQAIRALAASEEKYRLLADTMADVIWIFNMNTLRFEYVSPSIMQLRGLTVDEAMAQTMAESTTATSLQLIQQEYKRTVAEFVADPTHPKQYMIEIQQPCKNGELVWVEISSRYRYNHKGEILVVSSSRNISERKKRAEEILYLSRHDPLTGLLNRHALRQHVGAVSSDRDNGLRSSVIFLNIDNFRVINDALGHREGDRILASIAQQIRQQCGHRGQVYRYGGDEFVIVTAMEDLSGIEQLVQDLHQVVATQLKIYNQVYLLTASVGVCLADGQTDLEQTIKNADTALYLAKKEKRRITYYRPEMDLSRTREAILEHDMQRALDQGEFELYYQPIYNIHQRRFTQAEALIRWRHPVLGLVPPIDFIPIAERSRLIIPITDWVIRTACADLKRWAERGLTSLEVSVNLSVVSFEDQGRELSKRVIHTVQAMDLHPACLKLEITESMLMSQPEDVIRTLHALRHFGVRLALDDFGTGYSSFSLMKDLPLDIVKLDRSLIDSIDADAREQVIVQSMIQIIHGLDLEVVAEGVETAGQLSKLTELGCDLVQGYLFSKPLPVSEFITCCLRADHPSGA